jgi:diacylglycerol O-acyltransferase
VKRLAGIDANFLYAETETTLMHTLKIGVFDSPRAGVNVLAQLKLQVTHHARGLEVLRRRVVFVPFGLAHPVWITDANVDAERHVFHRRVASPGGAREMDSAIASIASTSLRRDRPLFEVWLLEGRSDGTLVVVVKLHHAVADGVASAAILSHIASDASAPTGSTSPDPRRRRLLRDALAEKPRRAREFVRLLAKTARDFRTARPESSEPRAPKPFEADQTVFNGAMPSQRSMATARLPLESLKQVRRAASLLGERITLNDVYMTLAAISIRRYLAEIDESPVRHILASVPVSVRLRGGAGRTSGNHLSNFMTRLPMHVDAPLEVLSAVHADATIAKANQEALGERTMTAWAEYTPANLFRLALKAYSKYRVADRHRPPANLVLSNVRGPAQPIRLGGLRLRELYSVGPVLHGIGLNVTAWSYAGELGICMQSRGDLPLALHRLTDGMAVALTELRDALDLGQFEVPVRDGHMEVGSSPRPKKKGKVAPGR